MSSDRPIVRVSIQQGQVIFTVGRKSDNYITKPWETPFCLPTPKAGVTLTTKGVSFSHNNEILDCRTIELPHWLDIEELMKFLPTQGWEPSELRCV